MIIQCEKCRTRFKLDDSRVTAAGIRVRCSRCSHTFVVTREAPEDEPDFDTILHRIGSPDREEREEETTSPVVGEQPGSFTEEEIPTPDAEGQSRRPDAEERELGRDKCEETPAEPSAPEISGAGFFQQGVALRHFQAPDESAVPAVRNVREEPSECGPVPIQPESAVEEAPVEDSPESMVPEAAAAVDDMSGDAVKNDLEASPPIAAVDAPAPVFAAEDSKKKEELPPLSIRSRRKGPALFPALVGVFIVLSLVGAGIYLFQAKPGLLLDILPDSVSGLAGLGGKGVADAGIRAVKGEFLVNREAGEIFVISGEVVNISRKPITSVQIRGAFYDNQGKVLLQRTVYCGNVLSPQDMAYQPFSSMEKKMKSQFGDGLANLDIPPGKGVPFMIVFRNVPNGVRHFGAEIANPAVTGR